jgi:pilus assembly protein CpaB
VTEEVPRTILTVAVTQEEAEKLVLADRTTDLTFALLGSETDSRNKAGVNPVDILPETFKGAAG